MVEPVVVVLDEDVLVRLRRAASERSGSSPEALARQFVEEGLRCLKHPGLVFKDGPSGRRAALVAGPDVWEIVVALSDVEEHGEDAFEAVAELLSLPVGRVRAAVSYYKEHGDEIDAEIAENERAARLAQEAWLNAKRSSA